MVNDKANRFEEDLFQGVWMLLHRYVQELHTTDGKSLTIQAPGVLNQGQGPDFTAARLTMAGQQWAGNVELHINESDWFSHGHHRDPRYDSVILHVAVRPGQQAQDTNGRLIPTLLLPHAQQLVEAYRALQASKQEPACQQGLAQLPADQRNQWLSKLVVQRLDAKAELASAELASCPLGWEEAFYRSLARSLGLQVNADPMLQLARTTPLKALLKVRDRLDSLEAILLGQAGLLSYVPPPDEHPYALFLRQEYAYRAKEFGLTPINTNHWQFMHLRPGSFPTLRLAQLAAILHHTDHLFSQVLKLDNLSDLEKLLRLQASQYWDTHYNITGPGGPIRPKYVGKERLLVIMINSVIPMRFAYARTTGNSVLRQQTIGLLEQLPPESNAIVHRYEAMAFKATNAMQTQALIELFQKFCRPRLCHCCPVGLSHIMRPFTPAQPAERPD